MRIFAVTLLVTGLLAVSSMPAMAEVTFDADGIASVEGKRFFPIGIYTYRLDAAILAELKAARFNTIVAGFRPEQLDEIHAAGLKAICVNTAKSRAVAKHPALLAWYLMDEPESGKTVPEVLSAYEQLKRHDPAHPVGLVHSMFEAMSIFRDCADFAMPDIYPVTAKRDAPLATVARYVDEARRVRPKGPACWPFIQAFGGPTTDGGKWALPTPQEVRCMTFLALARQATGILYFSYWPQGGETWRSLPDLNREVEQIARWLVADGKEADAQSSHDAVHVRARWVNGDCIVMAVNSSRAPVQTRLHVSRLDKTALNAADEGAGAHLVDGAWDESFDPLQVRVWTSGAGPGR